MMFGLPLFLLMEELRQKKTDLKVCYILFFVSKVLEKEYRRRDLNPHNRNDYRILSPACLPIPPLRLLPFLERKTGLEPATPTLARLCSTN